MRRAILAVALAACLTVPPAADAGFIGVAARASTLGAGVEAAVAVLPFLNIRGGIYGFQYDYTGTESGNDYELELKLSSMAMLADLRLGETPFRLTAGVLANGNQVDLTAETARVLTYEIGGEVYEIDEVGAFTGKLEFDALAPYAGIGLGNASGAGLGILVDLGVVFQGKPTVSLSTERELPEPSLQRELEDNLAREEAELAEELEDFQLYPVISVGLRFGF